MLLLGRQWYVALGHLRHFQAVCTPALPLYEPRWYTVSKPRLLRSISIMLFGVAISDVCKFTLYNKRLMCVRGPCGPVGTAVDAVGGNGGFDLLQAPFQNPHIAGSARVALKR